MAQVNLESGSLVDVQDVLYDFVRDEAVPGTSWSADGVFRVLGELAAEFDPINRALLAKRDDFQKRIDGYYQQKRQAGWSPSTASAEQDAADLESFLVSVGYLGGDPGVDFEMNTPVLDPEMDQNGPELVTPVTNASMAVGGANARWGSLYDAYFLSDIRPEIDRASQRPARLRMVVEETNAFLDEHVAAWQGGNGFGSFPAFRVDQTSAGAHELLGITVGGAATRLEDASKFIGFNLDDQQELSEFFLADNGLRLQFQLYPGGRVNEEKRAVQRPDRRVGHHQYRGLRRCGCRGRRRGPG